MVWYGTPRRRSGEPRLALESCSERMRCANRPGMARPQKLPEASQSAESTSYMPGSFCVPAARSHPIWRLHHHRSVQRCLGYRVNAYPSCSQTKGSPEEIRRFCTDPKEQAGSCAGSSLEVRERVLETRIELAGVDVALRLLSRGPDRVPMRASVGPESSRSLTLPLALSHTQPRRSRSPGHVPATAIAYTHAAYSKSIQRNPFIPDSKPISCARLPS